MALKRLALGLSVEEMAALLKCSPSTVKSIEAQSGRLEMSKSMAARLAAIGGESVKDAIDRMVEAYRDKLYRNAGIPADRTERL